ncbi:MAG: response regulator, partial [Bacteroidales bacterium]|nr:response regulator [Bacteroidales bacterium]
MFNVTKILIVDDERPIRNSLKGMLEDEGYSVDAAPDGMTALKMVAEQYYQVVLCDIKMPGMDGIEVLTALREKSPDTAVVIMTGHGDIDTAVECIKKGAYDFLVKPPDLNRILITIRNGIAQAKLVLIFCADCKKWYDAYLAVGCQTRKPGVGDLLLAASDAMIAAQNAVTAAESLGIGSCYIGDIMENCEAQRALLKLPEYVFPVGMVIFGYPTEQQMRRPKPERVEMQYVVHENTYQPLSDKTLEEMWSPRAGEKGYTAWMQAFCNRKYNSDFS